MVMVARYYADGDEYLALNDSVHKILRCGVLFFRP